MRRAMLCPLLLAPFPLWAEDITLNSRTTEAVIYASGGLVTHEVQLTAEAGRHRLIFPDLPPKLPVNSLRVTAGDVQIGAVRYRTDLAPARPNIETPEVKAAKDRIAEIEARIQAIQDAANRLQLAADAAEAQIAFLSDLGDNEAVASDVDSLRTLSRMIGEETRAARETMLDSRIATRDKLAELEDANRDLQAAQKDLAALVQEPEDRPFLVIDVASPVPLQEQPVKVTFFTDAYWAPTYDLRLTDGETPRLSISRGAQVYQNTGENWNDIKLSVSTQEPSGRLAPSKLFPDLRRILDPDDLAIARTRTQADAEDLGTASMAPAGMAQPSVMEETVATTQGLAIRYDFVSLVDIASGADAVRIPFDTLEFDAEIFARAIPLQDQTAYLIARFENTSGEPLPATGDALRFFDGGLVGAGPLSEIAAGDEVELAFGPIDGLQLTYTILNRNEGDRGLIARSNELSQSAELTARNLTDRTWAVELRDRVPYSEQEDLTITYTTDPRPDVEAVDDQRGILQWNIEMPPGNEAAIQTTYKITWPDGMILR